ncbi:MULTISPECIES: ABC transporter family substrate-binding protein [Prauserella salsuginis group]|uniref:ABC transporter family substrate-binding protein n=1 Tax=Prauserella salsuginis TaxID=387889 RepID=A0ABW6GAY6_9PSEU|nr:MULTISPECIES: ABC transporter family substrate-binding protein [Prauserella salsuginis group]MCR3722366.1 peptide/nickel transport system substrate-binding protein [Prauserella flava]MCR3736808.1 peptide/nickel transport system substrate-binding protein [Prauserella salsuginis]
MRRSKAISAMAVTAVSALVLTACGGGGGNSDGSSGDVSSMAEGKAQEGDVFKLADVPEMDPVTVAIDDNFTAYNNDTADANSSYNNYVLTSVLTAPTLLDGNNEVLTNGDVMESIEVTSEDPYTVEWKIKEGAKWSDGEPWDCSDLYLAWLSHSGKAEGFNVASSTGYELIEQPECKDAQTFTAEFSQPYIDYKGLFSAGAVLPAHVLEEGTGIDDITSIKPDSPKVSDVAEFWAGEWKGFDAEKMPGSGPYKIKSFDRNSGNVVLDKNPEWIGAKGGPKEITVRTIPDTQAMATALENGEINVAASTQPDSTAATTMQNLESQGVTYGSAPQLTYEHLDLNFKRIFADEAARKAFFAVVPRQQIVDKLLKGVQPDAEVLQSIVFFQGEDGYQDVYSDKADQGAEEAEKILQEAGWEKGNDGIYAKDGKRLSIEISHNENARRKQTVEIIQSAAAKAGIEVKDDQDANFLAGRVDKGDYDVALFGWSSEPFKTTQADLYSSDGGQNWQGLESKEVDEAYESAVAATKEDEARKHYQEADKALANEHATLPLFATPSMWGFRGIDRVYMQSYNGALWNAGEWEAAE